MNLANSDFKFRKANQEDHLKLKFPMKKFIWRDSKRVQLCESF